MARFARQMGGCVLKASTVTAPCTPPSAASEQGPSDDDDEGAEGQAEEDAFLAVLEATFTVDPMYAQQGQLAAGTKAAEGPAAAQPLLTGAAPAPFFLQPPPPPPPAVGPSSPPQLLLPSQPSGSGIGPFPLPRPSPRSAYLIQTQAAEPSTSTSVERLTSGRLTLTLVMTVPI
jgi:hypothetical protein